MSKRKSFQSRSSDKMNRIGKYEVTEKQFDIFIDECKYWIKYFGLLGWEVNYVFTKNNECRAWCAIGNLDDRITMIGLSSIWDIQPQDKALRRAAFHEVVELFTMKFYVLAMMRDSSREAIEEENHNLVRTLENSIFDTDYNRRFDRRKSK